MNRLWIKAGVAASLTVAAGTCLLAQTAAPAAGKFGLPVGVQQQQPNVPVMAVPAAVPAAAATPLSPSAPAPTLNSASSSSATVDYRNPIPSLSVKNVFAAFKGQVQGQLGGGVIHVVKFQFHPPNNRGVAGQTPEQLSAQVTITKNLDAASIPLLTALSRNEMLPSVSLSLYNSPDASGIVRIAFNVSIVNATIVSVTQYQDSTGTLEDVTLNISSITIDDLLDKTEFHWSAADLTR